MNTELNKWKTFLHALEKDTLQVEEIINFLNDNVKDPCYGCYFSSQSQEQLSELYDLEEKLINTLKENFSLENRYKYEEIIYLPIQHLYLKRTARYGYDEIYDLTPFYEVKKYTKTIDYYE